MKHTKENINTFIKDQKYAQKEYSKYLGVYIDCHLSWQKHNGITNSKICKPICILRKMREFLQ